MTRRTSSSEAIGAHVGVDRIARLLNKTPRRIQQLVQEGILPRAQRGRYDDAACVQAYIRHVEERLDAALSAAAANDSADEKTLNLRADLALKELRIAERRRELIPSADVVAAWERTLRVLRARIIGVRGAWAPRIVNLQTPADAAAVLDEMTAAMLAAMRDGAEEIEGDDEEGEAPAPGGAAPAS